jgi:hypothetical protein
MPLLNILRTGLAGLTTYVPVERPKTFLDEFKAFEKGLDAGQAMPPHSHSNLNYEPERALVNIQELNARDVAKRADLELREAKNTCKRGPKNLNTRALLAQFKAALKKETSNALEACKPRVERRNTARVEFNKFHATHMCPKLGEDSYSINATPTKQMLMAACAGLVDALINAFQYLSVMPYGAFPALAISVGMATVSVVTGAFVGTAIRYWCYGQYGKGDPKSDATRRMWRLIGVGAGITGIFFAAFFAQYRAVLDAAMKHGIEADLSSVLTTRPTISSITVFIAALTVLLIAAMKFRGGRGQPWTSYGDQADKDREVKRAEFALQKRQAAYFKECQTLGGKTIEQFLQQDREDRKLIQQAYNARDKCNLTFSDLLNSKDAFDKNVLHEIKRFREGVMAARPDMAPERFVPLPVFEPLTLPDTGSLDKAVDAVEKIFASRTEQLAELQQEISEAVETAIEEFPALLRQIDVAVSHVEAVVDQDQLAADKSAARAFASYLASKVEAAE